MTRATAKQLGNPPPTGAKADPRATDAQSDTTESSTSPWAERIRRAALGFAAALLVARAYWPGEATDEVSSAQGMLWVVGCLAAVAIALAGVLLGGRTRVRWRGTDTCVSLLFVMVAASAGHSADGRIAQNLAWQWVGVGLIYLLLRFLPHGDREIRTLFVVFIATATALSSFGIYQVLVVQPESRRRYLANPEEAMLQAGVTNDTASRQAFKDRLLGSREPISTFSLANSLGGFLAAGLVLAIALGLSASQEPRVARRLQSLLRSVPCVLILLSCLILTKSRTAYVGVCAGLAVLAWNERKLLSPRGWLIAASTLVLLAFALVVAGVKTGQLDPQVVTESGKSLSYRGEFWIGTGRVLRDGATWWSGLGPGNFGGPYLRHKVPESSESIKDPHNAFLEVWTTAGLPALLVFGAALVLGIGQLLGRGQPLDSLESRDTSRTESIASTVSARWLLLSAGAGGWMLAMALRPDLSPFAQSLNPFENDYSRWIALGVGWLAAALLLGQVAMSRRMVMLACGAAVVALCVNLLGSGGIGYPPVALMLWAPLAIGLAERDLAAERDDARRLGRGPAFLLAMALAALAGTFAGTIGPSWAAQSEIEQGEAALANAANAAKVLAARAQAAQNREPPRDAVFERLMTNYQNAVRHFRAAARLDPLSSRPWMLWALAELEAWRARGANTTPDELVWHRVNSIFNQALETPRDPNSLSVESTRYQVANSLLNVPGWPSAERLRLLEDRLKSSRRITALNPTNAASHADQALAAAGAGDVAQAADAAKRALELDRNTPHATRKLPDTLRQTFEKQLPKWENASAGNQQATGP